MELLRNTETDGSLCAREEYNLSVGVIQRISARYQQLQAEDYTWEMHTDLQN